VQTLAGLSAWCAEQRMKRKAPVGGLISSLIVTLAT
jgi:hypothetical protein